LPGHDLFRPMPMERVIRADGLDVTKTRSRTSGPDLASRDNIAHNQNSIRFWNRRHGALIGRGSIFRDRACFKWLPHVCGVVTNNCYDVSALRGAVPAGSRLSERHAATRKFPTKHK
jgi:hypothetical protein